jgi:hypothetical protein
MCVRVCVCVHVSVFCLYIHDTECVHEQVPQSVCLYTCMYLSMYARQCPSNDIGILLSASYTYMCV